MGTPIILKRQVPKELESIVDKAMALTREICKLPEEKVDEIIDALEDYQYDMEKINFKNIRTN